MLNPNDSAFLALVFRQKYINRWGLMRNTKNETLAEHAAECALITHALATVGNVIFGRGYNADRAVTLALYHDVPEVFTGDMPTPIKYANAEIRAQFAEIERQSARSLVEKLPAELRGEYAALIYGDGDGDRELHRLVKIADKLCAYLKCVEEEKSGNREFSSAGQGIWRQLEADDTPELVYFREHFLAAFTATLDEQQEKTIIQNDK